MVRTARHERRGEVRLPPVLATLVAISLYALLPSKLVVGPRLALPLVELALLVALVVVNPVRMTRETAWSRGLSLGLAGLMAATNTGVLGLLVYRLTHGRATDGNALLLGSLQVWLTNVIAFALIYWQLDRGGAVARTQQAREDLPDADFRFSQDENAGSIVEVARGSSEKSDWVPTFLDYLYVSTTNSTAFSPTDTMPLTTRAKSLMATESVTALLLSVLVIAHGVGSLK